LATSETELQELVDRLDRVSRKYSLLINVDKAKLMASDGIACRILIQNEQLEQVDLFPYLGSLITEECTTEFRTRLKRGQAIGESLQKIWKKPQHTDFNENTTNESASADCINDKKRHKMLNTLVTSEYSLLEPSYPVKSRKSQHSQECKDPRRHCFVTVLVTTK